MAKGPTVNKLSVTVRTKTGKGASRQARREGLVPVVLYGHGADPLYRQLCKAQKCYRARLTPKPWRCGVRHKPERWPFLDARAEKHFQKWQAQYESFAAGWATCEFVRKIGNGDVHPARFSAQFGQKSRCF